MESKNIIYVVWYKDGTNEIYDTYQPEPAISYVDLFDAEKEIASLKAEIENLEEANHDWQVQSDKYEGAYLKAKAEIERKDEALNNIKIGAERIQNLDYGWEGDCGAINHAEFIETLAEQPLQDKEK
jgi:hypothetical protein